MNPMAKSVPNVTLQASRPYPNDAKSFQHQRFEEDTLQVFPGACWHNVSARIRHHRQNCMMFNLPGSAAKIKSHKDSKGDSPKLKAHLNCAARLGHGNRSRMRGCGKESLNKKNQSVKENGTKALSTKKTTRLPAQNTRQIDNSHKVDSGASFSSTQTSVQSAYTTTSFRLESISLECNHIMLRLFAAGSPQFQHYQ